jgi:hypothetical protein
LQELSAASSSYARQARATPRAQHAASSELQQTIAQLRAQLLAIEPDVEELEDAIAAIEEPGVARRLGISDSEVRSRRSVVQRIQGELEVCNGPHADRSGTVSLVRQDLITISDKFMQAIRKQCPAAVSVSPLKYIGAPAHRHEPLTTEWLFVGSDSKETIYVLVGLSTVISYNRVRLATRGPFRRGA